MIVPAARAIYPHYRWVATAAVAIAMLVPRHRAVFVHLGHLVAVTVWLAVYEVVDAEAIIFLPRVCRTTILADRPQTRVNMANVWKSEICRAIA